MSERTFHLNDDLYGPTMVMCFALTKYHAFFFLFVTRAENLVRTTAGVSLIYLDSHKKRNNQSTEQLQRQTRKYGNI